MTDYWIKLYMEILDDPKMGTLPDRLWRRVIELFLIAKSINKYGDLPDTSQIAWMLRMDTDDLQLDMKQIATTGIIRQTETGWFVVNFQKRQAPATTTERVHAFRDRQQKQQYYGNETELKHIVTQSRADTEAEQKQKQRQRVAAPAPIFLNPSNSIMPMISRITGISALPPKENARIEQIHAFIDDHGIDKTEAALKEAYTTWINTPRKNGGGTYSPLNFGWVDKAQEILLGLSIEKPYEQMTQEEKIAWIGRQ
jgi:hypothetical protein